MSEKPRYRVTFEFDAPSEDYARRYASALDCVWGEFSEITSQGSTLDAAKTVWECVADPIRRTARVAGSEAPR